MQTKVIFDAQFIIVTWQPPPLFSSWDIRNTHGRSKLNLHVEKGDKRNSSDDIDPIWTNFIFYSALTLLKKKREIIHLCNEIIHFFSIAFDFMKL
jgi:hypothetical protein